MMFNDELDKFDLILERSLHDVTMDFYSDVYAEDGEQSSKNPFKTIVKFFIQIFEKIADAIDDIKKNEYPEPAKKKIIQQLEKIYARVGDVEVMTIDIDYERIEKEVKEVINKAAETIAIVEKAIRSNDPKAIAKLTKEIDKNVNKMSSFGEGIQPQNHRTKTLCRISVNYLNRFPGENINHLEKMCKDVKTNFVLLEKRLDAPTNNGIVYDIQSTKELQTSVQELSKLLRKCLKVYRGTYNKIIDSLIVRYKDCS